MTSKRPETGVIKFGDDWPGIFIRGDDAHGFKCMLEDILSRINNPKKKINKNRKINDDIEMRMLIGLFKNCNVDHEFCEKTCQRLKDFNDCEK